MRILNINKLQGIDSLAKAIVIQACNDYINLKRKGRFRDANSSLDELLQFFHSRWFGILTDIPPEQILKKLDGEL